MLHLCLKITLYPILQMRKWKCTLIYSFSTCFLCSNSCKSSSQVVGTLLGLGPSSSCCLASATWVCLSHAHSCGKEMGQWGGLCIHGRMAGGPGCWSVSGLAGREKEGELSACPSRVQLATAAYWHFLWQQCGRGEEQVYPGAWLSWDMESTSWGRSLGDE